MDEFGAGGVAASSAVVVGWVPVGEANEECGVDDVGDVGVAEPNCFPAFLTAGAHPVGQAGKGVVVVDDDGLDDQVFALQEQLSAGLGGGNGGCGHQFGDLSDRVGAAVVVVEVVAHAGWVATCLALQA